MHMSVCARTYTLMTVIVAKTSVTSTYWVPSFSLNTPFLSTLTHVHALWPLGWCLLFSFFKCPKLASAVNGYLMNCN